MRIYTILDRVAEEAGPVFCAANDGVAVRQFKQLVSNTFDKEDYKLYFLAEYDPASMKIILEVNPVEIQNYFNLDEVKANEAN